MERCPSGLRCKPGTFVWGQLHRGFESPPLRFFLFITINNVDERVIMKKVLCFGDSNTYGYCPGRAIRYDKNSRWSGILKQLCDGKFEIIEAGCNNRTAFSDNPAGIDQTGYKVLPNLLQQNPDYIILAIGLNDLQYSYAPTLQQVEDGIKLLIRIIKETCPCAKIVLAAPSVITTDILHSYFINLFDMDSIEKSKHMPAIYKTIAQSEDCIFIDLNKIAKVSEADGLHYSAEEHQKIAQAMFELLNNN